MRKAVLILLALLVALPVGGGLLQGQAYASPDTVTYYFDSDGGPIGGKGGSWADPGYFVDNILTNYATTSSGGDLELLDGNTCPADDLGIITKVELRAYAYGDGNDELDLIPIFGGANEGDAHVTVPADGVPGWGDYVDITADTNHPDWSAWSQIQDLDVHVEYDNTGKSNTMYCAKVEIRVTYTPYVAPTVTTQAVTSKGSTTATGHGNITATGGQNCSKRGVCWNTTGNPTVADDKSEETDSFGTGAFSRWMTGQAPGEHYYVKAYAYNSAGYGYGAEVEFDTWEPPVSDIDVGADPIDRTNDYSSLATYINKHNPANASGILHSIKVWAGTNITGLIVGTFYTTNGDTLKCRDSEVIGAVEAGAERTFSGLSITVVEGDYIGCYFTGGTIEIDLSGSTGRWTTLLEHIDPGDEADYIFFAGDAISLYGYGDIVGVVVPTVTTQAATDIEDTTATGSGNITNTGGENCDIRGIVWDLASHGDPGDTAPGASDYANDVAETNGFGTGAFTRSLTGLPTGDTIYARAYAHNSAGYAYGGEVNFLTKPPAPTPPAPSVIFPEAIPLPVGIGHLAWFIPMVLFSILAFWMCNGLLFMLAGGSSLMMGFSWYDIFTTNLGLSIGILLVAYSLVCLVFAIGCLFKRRKTSEE